MVMVLFSSIFRFLSSFFGFLLFSAGFFFLLGVSSLYPLAIGFFIVSVVLFLSRTDSKKLSIFKSHARKKFSRSFTNRLASRVSNRFFCDNISRSFLLLSVIFLFRPLFVVPFIVFSCLVILSMMYYERTSFSKVLFSALLGSGSGFIGVFLSSFFV